MEPEDDEPRLREQLRAQQAENQALQRENARLHEEYLHDAQREKVEELLHDLQLHQSELQTQNEELRCIQEQLTEARDRYSDLYDYAPVGYLTLNAEGRLVEANFSFASLLGGIERQHLLQQPLSRYIARESQEDFHFFWLRLQQSGEMTTVELVVNKADGTTFWARLDAIVARKATSGEARETREYRVTVSDITDRKQAEEATREKEVMRESEERFRTLANTLPQLAWIARSDGYIYWFNQRWYEFTGTTPKQMEGWGWQSVHDPAVLPRVMEEWQSSIATGQPFDMDFPLRGADGHYRSFLTRVLPMKDADGHVVQWFGTNTDITERKQAEAERERLLVEVQRRIVELDTIFNAIVDPMIAYNAEGIAIKANPALVMTLGRDPAGMSEVEVAQALAMRHPDGTPMHEMEIPATRSQRGEVVKGERLLATDAEGHEMILQITAARLIQDGRRWGVVSIWHDITKREQAFEEAKRRAAELDATFDAVVDPMISFNDQGTIVQTNPSMRRQLGYDPLGLSYTEYAATVKMRFPDGRAINEEEVPAHRALQGETVVSERLLVMGTDGVERVIQVTATPVETDGYRWGAVAIWHDITERENLLNEVQIRAAELDATITGIADGLVIYNAEGEVVRMNDAARALLRFSDEEPHPSLLHRCVHRRFTTPDGKPLSVEQLPVYRALRGERVQGVAMVVDCPPDERIDWVSASAGPIFAPDHRLLGVVANFTDITRLHNLQEQQKALLQMASHDLRVPLTVIKGHAQVVASMLEEKNIDGLLRQSMTAIDRGVNRMDTMIQDLVDVTRWEGVQLELKREPVALPPYVEDLLRRLSMAMETSCIRVEMPAGLPPVFADYARLERILVNLLSNALKYSDPGTPVLLRARQQEGQVVVSVSDQGQGIAPEEIPRLFTRFYRSKVSRKAEGIGLGLYITRVLVEAQGGRVWVESEVGKGSTFYFTLPVVKSDE